MLDDGNDYPLLLPRRALRSAMFRTGLTRTLGSRYWRPTDQAPYIHMHYRRSVEMFTGIPKDFADPKFGAMIGPDSARWSRFEESVTAVDDCLVEPNRCSVIGPDQRLVTQSLGSRLLPLFPSAWRHARRSREAVIPEAVVYDGFQSSNLYHHMIERLPAIALLIERSGLPPGIPLVVNRWIFDSRFFAYLRNRSPAFAALNWRVQEPDEWLRVGRAYLLTPAPFEPDGLSKVRNMYGTIAEPAGKRVFLSRDRAKFARAINNEDEVAALLRHFEFETIYAEHLLLDAQQRTFEMATHLVALQGMGLAQQLFMRPEQAHILELMPADRLQSEYYWQGWTMGMRFYDVLAGSALDRSGNYHIDIDRLERAVRRMLAHPSDKHRYGETLI